MHVRAVCAYLSQPANCSSSASPPAPYIIPIDNFNDTDFFPPSPARSFGAVTSTATFSELHIVILIDTHGLGAAAAAK